MTTTNGLQPARSTAGAEPTWLQMREKGTVLGIRFLLFVGTAFGRPPARLVLRVIALYYAAFHASARAASRAYLARIHGRPPTWRMVYQHILCFAQVTLDRAFLLQRREDLFEVTHTGHEHLVRLHAEGRGAILLSAHFGSQAAMNLQDHANRFRINLAGHFENARMINSVLERLSPETSARIINIDFTKVLSVFDIKRHIDAGEMVAMTPDRFGPQERTIHVDFLGGRAAFSMGPFLLATLLRCPIYLTFAVYRDPNKYDLYCEPLCEPLDTPRSERTAVLADIVQRFATRLEHYCRLAPDNWFNFYDFWNEVHP